MKGLKIAGMFGLFILFSASFSIPAMASTVTVTVPGSWSESGWWVDTGLIVTAGSVITVEATGQWNPWVGHDSDCGADGYRYTWDDSFLTNASFGALMAVVGDTPPAIGSEIQNQDNMLLLGSNVIVTSPATGYLWLGMNDDAVSGHDGDNSGSLIVTVTTVSAVPIPGAVWLFGSGLVGLIRLKRKRLG